MKTSHDPRHLLRQQAIRELFTWGFQPGEQIKSPLATEVIKNVESIDEQIQKAAPNRPLSQINKIDLAILRLGVFELIIEKGNPFKVVVDEMVELAKEYGGSSSPALINGALGNIIKSENLAE